MGIYAASPNSNQITGSITINPAGASINVRVWTEDFEGNETSTPQTLNGLRAGGETITLNSGLEMDCYYANYEDIKPVYVKVEITNNSANKELGAYFSNKAMTANATKADILTSEPLANNDKITAKSSMFYRHIAPQGVGVNVTTLTLEFKPNAKIDTSSPVLFDYFVNVEDYSPNMIGATLNDTTAGFIKVSSQVSTTPRTEINASSGFKNITTPSDLWVVIPEGITTIGDNAFSGCTALTRISLPSTLTTVGDNGLNAANLLIDKVPDSVVNFTSTSFPGSLFKSKTEGYINYTGTDTNPYFFVESVADDSQSVYTINENAKYIDFNDFAYLPNLSELNIPEGIEVVDGITCFYNGSTLDNIIENVDGVNYVYAGSNPLICLPQGGSTLTVLSETKYVYFNTGADTGYPISFYCYSSITFPSSVKGVVYSYESDNYAVPGTLALTIVGPSSLSFNVPTSSIHDYDYLGVNVSWYKDSNHTIPAGTTLVGEEETVTYYCVKTLAD